MNTNLKNKTAIVCGSTQGIGKAIASRFIEQGFRVHICDIDQPAMQALSSELPLASCSLCDVSQADEVEDLFSKLAKQEDHLDVLVNSAGISGPTAEATRN